MSTARRTTRLIIVVLLIPIVPCAVGNGLYALALAGNDVALLLPALAGT